MEGVLNVGTGTGEAGGERLRIAVISTPLGQYLGADATGDIVRT